ncbi:MAG TPA: vanadium-dependent haloperoxidase [Cytophagales bacterium]|nr:vanadium-dependent haloperoxidase [Cytophagales bacterium]
MKKPLSLFLPILLIAFFFSCNKTTKKDYKAEAANPDLLHECTDQLNDVIIFDVFKPPVATRIFVYANLAAYETLRHDYPAYGTLASKINAFEAVPAPDKDLEYCLPLASLKAYAHVGRALTFSAEMWDNFEKDFFKKFKEMGVPDDVYKRSLEYGDKVAKHVLDYSSTDGYKTTRGSRHTLGEIAGSWVPTPPNYAEACEPKWNNIRTFTLDSCTQFSAPDPAPFDLSPNSEFYKLTKEVYDYGQNLTDEQREIAYFWDDNPMVTNIKGHIAFAEKKMSPTCHWIAITKTISKEKKQEVMKALETYTLTSIALNDAFIGCWDSKFKTDRIRPVSVINQIFDNKWLPFLETPPFPEYTSGHSSISAAAGIILTHVFGDNVAFIDSTEYKYGHGVRKFESFKQAYWEVSMSRVYGGIHYRDGVEQGTYQGEKIGEWVWKTLKDPLSSPQNIVEAETEATPTLKSSTN